MMQTFTYEKIVSESGFESIKRTDATDLITIIPVDENNSDYQAYLESLKPLPETPKSKK
jgi:hypothetical protein